MNVELTGILGAFSSSCFKISDPAEYNQICQNLSSEKGWTKEKAVCATAEAYGKTCKGLELSKLQVCRKN